MTTRIASSLLAGLTLLAANSFSQTSAVTAGGNLSLSSEFYSAHGVAGRRPSNTQRGIFQFNVTLFDQIQLPFEAFYASGQTGYRQPFNQFGVSPRISDWMTFHAGYYSARLSDLTFGDTRLLGAGIELTPGPFRFTLLYGRSDAALQPDTLLGTQGTYRRTMWGGKIGYGSENEFFVHLNLWHAIDDSASLFSTPAGFAPQENLVASLAFGVPIADEVTFDAEIAGSALSNDIRSQELSGKGIGHFLFVPRTSSQVDAAAKTSLGVTPFPFMSARLTARWIGPGFVSFGYPQTPGDVFEWTFAPSFRFLQNALIIRSSFGLRENNLRNNKLSTTKRSIWSFGTSAQITDQLAADLQYSNYGMRSTPKNDTLRIENVSQSLTLTPRYLFEAFGSSSSFVLTYSFQDTDDKNVITTQTNRNQTQSLMASWSLAFPSTLNLTSTLLWTSSRLPSLTTSVFNISESAGYQFFENALSTVVTVGYSSVKTLSTDGQFTFSMSLAYGLGPWGTVGFALFNNNYSYGNASTGTSFSEVQGTLSYSIGF